MCVSQVYDGLSVPASDHPVKVVFGEVGLCRCVSVPCILSAIYALRAVLCRQDRFCIWWFGGVIVGNRNVTRPLTMCTLYV